MKQHVLTALSIVCATAALHADQAGTPSDMQSKQPMMQEITPSAEPKVTRWADPFITAEFIYWKAVQEGMTYAYPGNNLVGGIPVRPAKGHVAKPDFDFEPGFKVGAGLKFRHDGWDLYANYTWFQVDDSKSHASKGSNPALTSGILTDDIYGGPYFGAAKASLNWELEFSTLDVELGRNYYISKNLTMRPNVGLKFAWIDQDVHIKYDQAYTVTLGSNINVNVNYDQDDFAVGIRAGLDTVWNFCDHFGVYGDFYVSAMWNDFDSHRKDKIQQLDDSKMTVSNLSNSSNVLTPVIELALGLRYDTTFHNDDFMFLLQAGWEEQIWLNQYQFFNLQDLGSHNLTLQGLTLKAGIFF